MVCSFRKSTQEVHSGDSRVSIISESANRKINSSIKKQKLNHDSTTQEDVERVRAEVEDAGTISEEPPVEETSYETELNTNESNQVTTPSCLFYDHRHELTC